MSIARSTQSVQINHKVEGQIVQLPLWQFEELLDELAATKRELDQERQAKEQVEELLRRERELTDELLTRVHALGDEDRKIAELFALPSKQMSASQKLTMWAARKAIKANGKDGEELTDIRVGDIAKTIGISRDTAGDNLAYLKAAGGIAREDRKERTGNKKHPIKTRVALGLTLFSETPASIYPEQPRNHGGDRVKCEKCGSENVDLYVAYECRDCGHVHGADIAHLRGKSSRKN